MLTEIDEIVYPSGHANPLSEPEIRPEPEIRNVVHGTINNGMDTIQGEVSGAKALMRAAGLNWTAVEAPLATEPVAVTGGSQWLSARPVATHKAIVRSDTGDLLGIVGANYGVLQNEAMAELADAVLVADAGWRWGKAGVFENGSRCFLQLKAPVRSVGGEQMESNLSLFNSFDGSLRFSAGFSDTVIVCRNTFAIACGESRDGISLRHTSKVEDRVKIVTCMIEAARKHTEALDNSLLKMMSIKITESQVRGLALKLVGDGPKMARVRDDLARAYYNGPGHAEGTAWGAFQAVTNYTTHGLNVRGANKAELREESSWWGRGADMVADAYGILANEEAVAQLQYVCVVR